MVSFVGCSASCESGKGCDVGVRQIAICLDAGMNGEFVVVDIFLEVLYCSNLEKAFDIRIKIMIAMCWKTIRSSLMKNSHFGLIFKESYRL